MAPIAAMTDPSAGIKAWVSTLFERVPKRLRDPVLSKLVQALLYMRSGQPCSDGLEGELLAGQFCFLTTVAPSPSHLRIIRNASHQGFVPILITPASSVVRACKLVRRPELGGKVEILGFEVLIATVIISEISKGDRSVASQWEAVISAYNHSIGDAGLPPIRLAWKRVKSITQVAASQPNTLCDPQSGQQKN